MSSTTTLVYEVSTNYTNLQYDWSYFAALPTAIILAVTDLWMLISLIHYGIKTGKWQRMQKNRTESLNSGLIYTSVIVCASLCFIYHLVIAFNYFDGYDLYNNQLCDAVADFNKFTYALVVLSVNVFLWLRQRVFYASVVPNVHFGKLLKVFSFSIIFFIYIGGFSGLLLSVLPKDNFPSSIGCIYKPNKNNFRSISLYITASVLFFGQVGMVYLLIHALRKSNGNITNRQLARMIFCNDFKMQTARKFSLSAQNCTTTSTDKTIIMVQKIIRKTIVFAVLSLISDTVVLIMVLKVNHSNTRGDFGRMLACFAVLLNLLFIVLSFISRKSILISIFRIHKSDSGNADSSNTNQRSTQDTTPAE